MDDGQWARREPDRPDIEVFATGTTVVSLGAPALDAAGVATDAAVVAQQLRRGGAVVRHGYEHARDLQARPGHRPGGAVASASSRAGGDTDIVRPVLIDPILASALADSGALFTLVIPHLTIVERHDPADRSLVWRGVLIDLNGRPIPVSLHILGSPSMVVTVLELVPQRRIRWHREAFVRHGIAALDAVARRLEAARPRLAVAG